MKHGELKTASTQDFSEISRIEKNVPVRITAEARNDVAQSSRADEAYV